ncbi:MAG TPA: polysaccharide deacetylase [Syntrophomonas sp.]|nr:polysaccharide deacetylase [Syntrophomonas sp.]
MAASGSGAIYQGSTGSKAVAVTVNVDWGGEYIPAMLEALQKSNARATFFVTGSWAENNPELMKTIAAADHSIQNHGYKHVHFNSLKAAQVQEQIKQAEDVIFAATGKKSQFFAPPYGEKNPSLVAAVNAAGYQYIMWSVDTIDWQKPAPQVIVERVMKKVHNDAIILMHPTEPTVKALPEILAGLNQQGYKMMTIEELLASPEQQP